MPHPHKTQDVPINETILKDYVAPQPLEFDLKKLSDDGIDELYEEWAMLTPNERGGYSRDFEGLKKALADNAEVFQNDLQMKNIIERDLRGLGFETDESGDFINYSIGKNGKNSQKNAKMSSEFLEKGEKLSEQEVIEALENSTQKGRDMLVIGKENFSPAVLEWALKNNKKVAVDFVSKELATELGFKYPKVKRTIDAYGIRHALNRHGVNSNLVKKSGQKPVTLENIQKWTDYADDKKAFHTTGKSKDGQDVYLSGKQINGYYVIVESVRPKVNELGFKDMYFENGSLFNHKDFKKFKK